MIYSLLRGRTRKVIATTMGHRWDRKRSRRRSRRQKFKRWNGKTEKAGNQRVNERQL